MDFYKGEAKTVTWTVKDSSGNLVDLSSASISFAIAPSEGETPIVTKTDSDFDDSNEANGVTSTVLTSSDLGTAGTYVGQLKIQFSATNIDKSLVIPIVIRESVV